MSEIDTLSKCIEQRNMIIVALGEELENYRSIAEREGAIGAISQLDRAKQCIRDREQEILDAAAEIDVLRTELDEAYGRAFEVAAKITYSRMNGLTGPSREVARQIGDDLFRLARGE
jgi:hypothetical protein